MDQAELHAVCSNVACLNQVHIVRGQQAAQQRAKLGPDQLKRPLIGLHALWPHIDVYKGLCS